MKALFLVLAFLLVAGPSVVSAQSTDTTPPDIVGALSSLSPPAVDVTSGPRPVDISLVLTDDLSGVTFTASDLFVGIQLRSPSGGQFLSAGTFTVTGTNFTLVSGGSREGTWAAAVIVPQFAESGTWTVEGIVLQDVVGNTAFFNAATLASKGFQPTLEVTSNPDGTPPRLVSLELSPAAVDTSDDEQQITIKMELADDGSGVDFALVLVGSPNGSTGRECSPELTGGTTQDGTWTALCFFPRFSQAGTWTLQIFLGDAAGNQVHLTPPTSITVTSTPSDTTPPVLSAFRFSPTFINTSTDPATVKGTVTVTDDLSGFSGVVARFRSPSGGQSRTLFSNFLPVSGDRLNGVFNGSVEFPQFSEAGTWHVQSLNLFDQVGNQTFLDTAALLLRGFPTVLNVVLPSLEVDGQITDAGGTVQDAVFGARAQVTLPPGVLSGPTDVAIDVLESPLTFPMPSGFAAPGTRFVNISFTPEPAMPLSPPGATLVLPLVDPMPALTPLALYRVDPATGTLVPDISVFTGQAVIGTVDAGGLTATFTGVSHLSVVVALAFDTEPPVVTPPANITVGATQAAGATAGVSAALAAFLAGATAVDNADPAPQALAPQVGGSDVTGATVFPIGSPTTVAFRFEDAAGNIGTATATVSVVLGRPRLVGSIGARSTPALNQRTIDVVLKNTGNGNAREVKVSQLVFKTLTGTGNVTLASSAPPIIVGSLDAGASATVRLTLNVPASVKRFSITANGTLKDVNGAMSSYSLGLSVIP